MVEVKKEELIEEERRWGLRGEEIEEGKRNEGKEEINERKKDRQMLAIKS